MVAEVTFKTALSQKKQHRPETEAGLVYPDKEILHRDEGYVLSADG